MNIQIEIDLNRPNREWTHDEACEFLLKRISRPCLDCSATGKVSENEGLIDCPECGGYGQLCSWCLTYVDKCDCDEVL